MDETRFGLLVRRYRRRLMLTQEELAERAQLSTRSIRGMESGAVRSPRMHSVAQLADALHLSELERRAFEAASRIHLE